MKRKKVMTKHNAVDITKSKSFKIKIYKEIEGIFNHKVVVDKRIDASAKLI